MLRIALALQFAAVVIVVWYVCVFLYTNFRMGFSTSIKDIMGFFIEFVINLYTTFRIRSFLQYRFNHYIIMKCCSIICSIFLSLSLQISNIFVVEFSHLLRLSPWSLFMTIASEDVFIISSSCFFVVV